VSWSLGQQRRSSGDEDEGSARVGLLSGLLEEEEDEDLETEEEEDMFLR